MIVFETPFLYSKQATQSRRDMGILTRALHSLGPGFLALEPCENIVYSCPWAREMWVWLVLCPRAGPHLFVHNLGVSTQLDHPMCAVSYRLARATPTCAVRSVPFNLSALHTMPDWSVAYSVRYWCSFALFWHSACRSMD